MEKKQKKMFISLLIVLLLIVLLIGFTLAKYYSTYNGNAALQIAKWNFKVDGWSSSETKQLSLTNIENNVKLDDGMIAPGFEGKFELVLDATDSEVDVEYYVEAAEGGARPENLQFKAVREDNKYHTPMYDSLQELAENELKGTILREDEEKVIPYTIYCIWPYETNIEGLDVIEGDAKDTAVGTGTLEGKEDQYDYTFSLRVVGTQLQVS